MTLDAAMKNLVSFALHHQLIAPEDRHFTYNALLDLFHLDAPEESGEGEGTLPLAPTATPYLQALCDQAVSRGLLDDSPARRDLFSTRIMGIFTARPSTIAHRFRALTAEKGIMAATDWFYKYCRMSDYIRVDAIAKNIRFFSDSAYGKLEITINLSKPEKDPRDIAALLTKKSTAQYPECMLCAQNEGYAGRLDFPARQTLRSIPVTLGDAPWHMQYSPYLYYDEHCIIYNDEHIPMHIDRTTFERLFDFLAQFPHYFIGSNADLPIVGGSILNHDHFQGGRHHFPMEDAPVYGTCRHPDFDAVTCELVSWPLTTLRLRSSHTAQLIDLADTVLAAWRKYSDPDADLLAYEGDTPHNTITPIARRNGEEYTLDLVLRNNRTTPEHPLGLFHPHSDLHHIKKENIGLIEVMGLFILPGRLEKELSALQDVLTEQRSLESIKDDAALHAHYDWLVPLAAQSGCTLCAQEAQARIRSALSDTCARVLYDAGVFKLDDAGKAAMKRFLRSGGFIL